MKYNLKIYAYSILLDLIAFAAFYFWIVAGNSNAGNVAIFMCWSYGVIGIAAGVFLDKTDFPRHRPPLFALYNWITALAVVLLLAYAGYFWCAAAKSFGICFMEAARTREPAKQITSHYDPLERH